MSLDSKTLAVLVYILRGRLSSLLKACKLTALECEIFRAFSNQVQWHWQGLPTLFIFCKTWARDWCQLGSPESWTLGLRQRAVPRTVRLRCGTSDAAPQLGLLPLPVYVLIQWGLMTVASRLGVDRSSLWSHAKNRCHLGVILLDWFRLWHGWEMEILNSGNLDTLSCYLPNLLGWSTLDLHIYIFVSQSTFHWNRLRT